MTVSTTILGLLPVMFGTGIGTEVMKRIASPMVGGLVTSTINTLIVIPAIYALVYRWRYRRELTPVAASVESDDTVHQAMLLTKETANE